MLWIASDNVLQDKAFSIAKNPKYDGYQRGLASIVYKVFDKKSSNAHSLTWINFDVVSKNKRPSDLAKELHEPIIKKFEKQKVHLSFIDNIWSADLADMQLISTFDEGIRSVLLIFIVNMHGLFL